MKKIFLLAALSLSTLAATSVNAQEKGGFTLGVGPVASLPLGDLGTGTSFGVGGEGQFGYGITDNITGFVQAGYSRFLGKDGAGGLNQMGGLLGARYHSNGFMGGVGLGYNHFSVTGASTGGFAYSPQIGYSFGKVDIIAHYTGVVLKKEDGKASYFGLKVFFNFLGK